MCTHICNLTTAWAADRTRRADRYVLVPLPTRRTANIDPLLDNNVVHGSQAKSPAAGVEQIAMPDHKDGLVQSRGNCMWDAGCT